jgi:hypothetical protein
VVNNVGANIFTVRTGNIVNEGYPEVSITGFTKLPQMPASPITMEDKPV